LIWRTLDFTRYILKSGHGEKLTLISQRKTKRTKDVGASNLNFKRPIFERLTF
jgi:hypothetical protein